MTNQTLEAPAKSPASDPAVRATMIGGSDAATVMGVNPYTTALELYLQKRGIVDNDFTSEPAEWGTILEPVLLREYAKRSGQTVVGRNWVGNLVEFLPGGEWEFTTPSLGRLLSTIRHTEHEFIGCHLDGLVLDEHSEIVALVEAKTAGEWMAKNWNLDAEGSDEIPDGYLIQCQHNSMVFESVTGLRLPVVVPTLIGGQRFRVFEVQPNADLQGAILEREVEFWGMIQNETPPDAGPDERGRKALNSLYPRDTGEELVVEFGDALMDLGTTLRFARVDFDAAQEAKTAAENAFKAAMGDLSTVISSYFKVTWKKSKDGEKTDWKAAFATLSVLAETAGVPVDDITTAQESATTPKPGIRRFLFKDTTQEEAS